MASKCTLPELVSVSGGVLLRYATAPGFAVAVCGYDPQTVETEADDLGINIIESICVCGWLEVDKVLLNVGVLPERIFLSRWEEEEEIPF